MGDGANYSVYVNTALEFDGSDSGARPDEAVSWGKIAPGAVSVKVYSEASIVWPIIMGESFVRNHRYATRLWKNEKIIQILFKLLYSIIIF